MTVTEQPSLTGSSEFAERVLDVLNSGMLALMISIGHRSGLFDAMAALPPATSERIAQVAGLDERYVREWLAAMTSRTHRRPRPGGDDLHAAARARRVADPRRRRHGPGHHVG